MTGFNLVDEPWVPVRAERGTATASIREVLTTPERFTGLDADEPDELFALLRLLTTIVNRALDGPRSPRDWASIAYDDGYDVAAIGRYLDRWRDRFELFDPHRPFLQFPELAAARDAPSLSVLLPGTSSGNAVTLFSHSSERDELALTPARAARALVHVVLNGRGSLKGGEYGVFGARVVVLGGDLRQVIVGNLPRYRGADDDGVPVWESPKPRPLPDRPSTPVLVPRGLLDISTWQWRAVLLRAPRDGRVTSCVYGPGPRPAGELPEDPSLWYDAPTEEQRRKDPSLPLRRDHRLRADRDVWRDADALVASLSREASAGVLAWTVDEREPDEFEVLVGGPIVELKGSWVLTGMRSATLPVPRALMRDDRLRGRVRAAVDAATSAQAALRGAVYALARELVRPGPGREPPKRRADDLVRTLAAESRFWGALPTRFDRFLRAVADAQALETWQAEVHGEARRVLAEVVSGLADSPRALRAAAVARRRLEGGLPRPLVTEGAPTAPEGATA